MHEEVRDLIMPSWDCAASSHASHLIWVTQHGAEGLELLDERHRSELIHIVPKRALMRLMRLTSPAGRSTISEGQFSVAPGKKAYRVRLHFISIGWRDRDRPTVADSPTPWRVAREQGPFTFGALP